MSETTLKDEIIDILHISFGIFCLFLFCTVLLFGAYFGLNIITGAETSFIGFLESDLFALVPVGIKLLLVLVIKSQRCF